MKERVDKLANGGVKRTWTIEEDSLILKYF
jgi:hypothetical protein